MYSFTELKNEYSNLWASMAIRPEKLAEVDSIVERIVDHKNRYLEVEQRTGVPWFVVAIIHSLEASGDFSSHLHNGDPLTARTVNHPPGRPAVGEPPFTWEDSAADALERFRNVTDWSTEHLSFLFEAYNGFGYRQNYSYVRSPYLWSYSNHYISGKYVSDGQWSPTAVSQQCGAMVLLKRLQEVLPATTATPALESPARFWPLGAGRVVMSAFGEREEGFNTGVDFGFPDGSADKPVYAVQSGTVIFCGAASGYGGPDPAGWLVIDSSDAEGSGCLEYGHIVREVALGEHVTAGQRIARVNPNQQTNGNVAPHLHLSDMPREYNRNRKQDPMPRLCEAQEP